MIHPVERKKVELVLSHLLGEAPGMGTEYYYYAPGSAGLEY
jgi:hypothetical protein